MNANEMRKLGKIFSDGFARGVVEVKIDDKDFVPLKPGMQSFHILSEREAADERCGWTHCNSCCGPCPTCGEEGAYYGDPER